MKKIPRHITRIVNAAVVSVLLCTIAASGLAHAAVQNPSPAARVSFTFDDGNASVYTQAAPTLKKYGLTGTSYVTTGCVGILTVPNTCRANENATYMTWPQIVAVQNTYGWEIGSHTVAHPLLASADPDMGQPNPLTPAQVDYELAQSKADLAAHGIDAKSFATPFGDYNPSTLAAIAKYYESHRGYADTGYNQYPYSDYLIRDQEVRVGVSVATVKGYIDQAIANKTWVVLTFHDIKTKPTKGADSYDYATADLASIAAYVKAKQAAGLIKSDTVKNTLVKSDMNLLPNGSFSSGLGAGWSTNNPAAIAPDTATNGSYPNPTQSVKLTATAAPAYLYSPTLTVDSNTTYLLKNYLSVRQLVAGEVSFYVDEFDGNGSWISGQYKGGERSVWTENFNFTYKPSSQLVKSARLQVGVPANSGIVAYYDTAQWFVLSTTTPLILTNLVANGTFDAGISQGWTTDSPTTITADASNNGSPANSLNSVKLTAAATNKHLFSPLVPVSSTATYSISSYLDLRQLSSSEIGYYIDEYDTNGAWISGQYKTAVSVLGKMTVSSIYTPTSSNVAKASLQVIVPANSNALAYFDNATWYKN
jgi:peptidoglycan/xylan/chitin deacetylase (PgdA/CDA1 family)